MTEPVRLSKRVAALVPCSRSEAEHFIASGQVLVDGVVVEAPQHRVADHQRVELVAGASLRPLAPATFVLHQPAGTGAAAALALLQPASRAPGDTAPPWLQAHLKGLVALQPLPPTAAGLVVFSQDPRILRRLQDAGDPLEQELLVEVDGAIAPDGLARLAHGLVWQGRPLPPAKVSWQSERRLRLAGKGLDAALVPWMAQQVGLRATATRRVRLGRVPLAGLPAGQWRYLQPHERF